MSTIYRKKFKSLFPTIDLTCPLYNKSVYDWDTSLYNTADDNNLYKCDNLESANASNFYTYNICKLISRGRAVGSSSGS